ncbi:DnaJ-domain-containing protein [Roridomyces roridus]|uniref:DnaJ-domain-containing protein n=1 Tax=Roridomyces roridus TaxID=1738132 RepID=A0AAD7BKE3_9AGAR|nr:DnaJ-domain-containing protein [Roridomyces roridus]
MAATLYEILGVGQSASADDIRRGYKAKALETHPDKLEPTASIEEKQAAEAKFHEVYEAFETLHDSYKRRAYDARHGITPARSYSSSSSQWEGEFSEEQTRRMKDREEWARKRHEEHEERVRNIRARAAAEREEMRRREKEAAEYGLMVERMLAELYRSNPEWAERKEKLKQTSSRSASVHSRPLPRVS